MKGYPTDANGKRLLLTGGILIFAIALFYAALWTPLATEFNTNIAYNGSVLLTVWDVVGSLVPYLFYWNAAAFILFLTERGISSWLFPALSAGASVLFNFGSLAVGLVQMNGSEMLGMDLFGAGFSVLLDIGQIALFRLFAYLFLEKDSGKRRTPSAMPLQKRYSRAILCCAALPALLALIGRLRYDFAVGAPTGKADLIGMVVHYLADVASAAIGYLVIFLIVDRLHQTKQGETPHDPA